jgi:hypothetical protein
MIADRRLVSRRRKASDDHRNRKAIFEIVETLAKDHLAIANQKLPIVSRV